MSETEVEGIFNPVMLALDALGKVDQQKEMGYYAGIAHAIQGLAYAVLAWAVREDGPERPLEGPEDDPDHEHVFFIGSNQCATCGAAYEDTGRHQHTWSYDREGTGTRTCTSCGETMEVEKA